MTVVVGSAVLVAQGLGPRDAARDIVPQGTQHAVPQGSSVSAPLERLPDGHASPLSIPFCEARADRPTDVLHVDGTAYVAECAYARPHHRYLWYHAGRTVMSSPDGIEVLVGDRLVRLSRLQSPGVRISMDGRYLAWFEEDALFVHDLVAGRPAGRFTMPDEILSAGTPSVEGMDWSGRTYVLVEGTLWVHDLDRDRWVAVSGLPAGNADPSGQFSYLTPDGLAVALESVSAGDPVARAIEGRVTPDGVFEPVRTVPLGTAVWSTDRSHVVQLAREGFTAHRADDLDRRVRLDVARRPRGRRRGGLGRPVGVRLDGARHVGGDTRAGRLCHRGRLRHLPVLRDQRRLPGPAEGPRRAEQRAEPPGRLTYREQAGRAAGQSVAVAAGTAGLTMRDPRHPETRCLHPGS